MSDKDAIQEEVEALRIFPTLWLVGITFFLLIHTPSLFLGAVVAVSYSFVFTAIMGLGWLDPVIRPVVQWHHNKGVE